MQRRRLSIGFADMTNYMRLTAAAGDERTAAHLQQTYLAAGDAIVRHGGRIWKYLGDAILYSCDDAPSAVAAAEEIAGLRWSLEGLELRFRVGIATGDVLVGEVGHPSLRLEDILGDTVNRAALLLREAADSQTGIALCPETLRLTADG